MIKKTFHWSRQRSTAIIQYAARQSKTRPVRRAGIAVAAVVVLAQIVAVAFHQGTLHRERSLIQVIGHSLDAHSASLEAMRAESQIHVDALSSQLARVQSHIARLDALGRTLAELTHLDEEANFRFDTEPGLGGRITPRQVRASSAAELGASIDALHFGIRDRALWLEILEDMVQHRLVEHKVYPGSWPVRTGWISSYYGMRKDPFHGRNAFHAGVDFAANRGTLIRAAADGFVEFAGARQGYGRMVRLRHGGSYKTIYAHADKLLVQAGQLVERGEPIARVGRTGRSTGPHLHFEVLKEGKSTDPLKFLSARRR